MAVDCLAKLRLVQDALLVVARFLHVAHELVSFERPAVRAYVHALYLRKRGALPNLLNVRARSLAVLTP